MASSYGAVTFHMLAEEEAGTLKRPLLVPTDFGITRNKVPFANFEQMQGTGRGNAQLKVKIELYSDSDFVVLLSYVGKGVARTLTTEWGEALSDMYLVDMQNVWRVTFAEEVHAELTFEKVL